MIAVACAGAVFAGSAIAEQDRFSRELTIITEQEYQEAVSSNDEMRRYLRSAEPSETSQIHTYLAFLAGAVGLVDRARGDALADLEARGYSSADAETILSELKLRRSRKAGEGMVADTVHELCDAFPSEWRLAPNLDQFAQKLANLRATEAQELATETKGFLGSLSDEGRATLENDAQKLSAPSVSVEIDYSALLADRSGVVMPMLESTCNQAKELSK